MTIRIIDIEGNVIFKYWRINNTIKKTLEKAVKKGVSLAKANLVDADLKGANLEGADFNNSYLSRANLIEADLRCANFRYADLSGAYLRGSNLSDANIKSACLVGTNLHNANLKGANLESANLYYANLEGAILKGANLYDTDLRFTKNIPDGIPMACPESGSFIGWKKVRYEDYEYLVKLEIPEDAERSSATTNKCRCSKAKVLEITNINTDKKVKQVTNSNYAECVYRVGEMAYPDYFDTNRWDECSHGIHFFMDKQDALKY